jgi:predicted amidophosphoribosyltransferase
MLLLPKGEWLCSYCRRTYPPDAPLCPACGWLHLLNAEACEHCGEPLSIPAQVLDRARARPRWLQRTRKQASQIRALEERASQERMERLRRLDQLRLDQDQLARQAEEEQRRLLTIVVGAGLFALILLGLIALILRMA